MGGAQACPGCTKPIEPSEGIDAFGRRFCSTCFIAESGKFHRPLRPEDLELLKSIGREAAGYLPPDLLRIIAVGFWRRSTGRTDYPPEQDLTLFVGEIQRLAALSNATRVMNLLQTWQGSFAEFVDAQMAEIRDTVKRLTDGEG